MKLKRSILFGLIIVLLSSLNNNAKATGTASGELIYEWLGDSTYRFFFIMYQDCSYGTLPDSVPMCLYNSCTNTTSSFHLQKWTATFGVRVGAGCSNYKNTCDSPSSDLTGYKEYWYGGLIYTLPSRCNLWRMSSYVPGRNANINNISNPTTSPLYVETTFNNTVSNENSSPYYSIKPILYVTHNSARTFNNGVIDPDQDSLVTEIIHPQTGVSSCSSTPTNVTYTTSSPSISVPSNPFQTNNQFNINPQTGATTFTSTVLGKNNYAIRTKEYRNGLLIGSVMREIQVLTIPQQTLPSTSFTLGCGVTFPLPAGRLETCVGQLVSFCFDATSADTNALIILSDNSAATIPNATITYSNQRSDSVHGTFSWTPTASDVGYNNLAIIVRDSTCRPPGVLMFYSQLIPIYVWGATTVTNDTFICPGSAIMLEANGGDNYSWTILLGGTTGSLSNPNLRNPIASPSVTTTYAVVSNASNFCPNNKDTVTVTVLPSSALTYPSISIAVSPDSNVSSGTAVTFTATTTNCTNPSYQWTLNGSDIPNAISSTYSSSGLSNNNIIACKLTCRDTCPTPKDTFSNSITIRIVNSVRSINENKREQITLYPNPNRGEFTIDIAVDDAKNEPIYLEVLNTVGQVIHKQTLTVTNNHLKQNIRLDHPPNGIYVLKMSISGQTNVSRFTISE